MDFKVGICALIERVPKLNHFTYNDKSSTTTDSNENEPNTKQLSLVDQKEPISDSGADSEAAITTAPV